MPRKPLGWMGTICQAQDATRPKGDSQARPVAIRNATQGAFGSNLANMQFVTGGIRLTDCLDLDLTSQKGIFVRSSIR